MPSQHGCIDGECPAPASQSTCATRAAAARPCATPAPATANTACTSRQSCVLRGGKCAVQYHRAACATGPARSTCKTHGRWRAARATAACTAATGQNAGVRCSLNVGASSKADRTAYTTYAAASTVT